MAFCGKCGTENESNAKFCKKCGNALIQVPVGEMPKMVPTSQIENASNNMTAAPKAFKAPNKMVLIAGAAVAIIVLAVVLIMNAKPTINLNKYLTFESEGYNGYGNARVSVDWDAIEAKYGDKLKYGDAAKEEYGSLLKMMTPLEVLQECVSVELDNNKKLSNGDAVNYTWDVNDEISEFVKCKVKYSDEAVTVSGLTELGTFDAFADLSVTYSGIAPNGTVEIDYIGSELNDSDFRLAERNGYSNGDAFKITIDESRIEYCAEKYGKVPESTEKEYTVEGLSSYVNSASEIDEEALSAMKSQAEDAYHAHVAKRFGEGEELDSLTYIGNYLLTNKGNSWNRYNYLYLVYKVQVHNTVSNSRSGKSYDKINDVYWYAEYNDIMLDGEGKTVVDTNNYNTPSASFTVESNVGTGWFSTKSWYYYGYKSLDELYKAVVTSNLDAYNHEDNIDENVAPAEVSKEEVTTEDNEDYILPNSDTEYITKEDLEGFSAEQCKIARNEIYARHGRRFKDEALQEYFDSKDWYEGTIDPDDFQESILSEIEIANKDVIVDYEEEKGYR